MKIGRKLFYEVMTGNLIIDTGEKKGDVIETTIEQDVSIYTVLSERSRDSFEVIELEYGDYAQDFAECNGYRVNLETKELEFSYPDPDESAAEQPFQPPLSEKIKELEVRQDATDAAVLQLLMEGMM